MVCPRCGRDNPEENEFCGRCGSELREIAPPEPIPDEEVFYCYKHPKVATNLRCGRCEKPVCTNCVVIGPAGPRCKECAKQHIAFRPGAVVHTAKSGLGGILKLGPFGIYFLILLGVTVFGFMRGCGPSHEPPPRYEQRDYEQGGQ